MPSSPDLALARGIGHRAGGHYSRFVTAHCFMRASIRARSNSRRRSPKCARWTAVVVDAARGARCADAAAGPSGRRTRTTAATSVPACVPCAPAASAPPSAGAEASPSLLRLQLDAHAVAIGQETETNRRGVEIAQVEVLPPQPEQLALTRRGRWPFSSSANGLSPRHPQCRRANSNARFAVRQIPEMPLVGRKRVPAVDSTPTMRAARRGRSARGRSAVSEATSGRYSSRNTRATSSCREATPSLS